MDGIDLWEEFVEARLALRQCHLERLACLGVKGVAVYKSGGVGVARVSTARDGTFRRYAGGAGAVILPVREYSRIIDLVAFRTAEPERFWVRAGLAEVLGFDHASACVELGRPLHVYQTPLSWLRAGGPGGCSL